MTLTRAQPTPDPWQHEYALHLLADAARRALCVREAVPCTAEGERVWRVTRDVASGAGVTVTAEEAA